MMPTTQKPADVIEPSALEFRAEIPSLESLHAERRQLIESNKRLKALHGPFGHWDDHRKRMVHVLRLKYRLEANASGKKVTESEIEDMARGSEEYGRFIDEGLTEATEWQAIANRLAEIEDEIHSRGLALTAYSKEIGLQR